jgi:hypothetical protein
LLIILAALFLGAILLGALFPGVPSSDVKVSGFILVGLIALAIAGFRLAQFPCPRCGKLFFRKGWKRNGFTQQCMHCGLPKWTEHETSKSINA